MDTKRKLRWTPADRNNFIADAVKSEELKGKLASYGFVVFANKVKVHAATAVVADDDKKLGTVVEVDVDDVASATSAASTAASADDEKKVKTEALASTIFRKDPAFKYISLGFYYELVERIRRHHRVGHMLWRDVMVVVKGASAYAYHAYDRGRDGDFPHSDLDVTININPALSDKIFESVRGDLHVIVLQTLSHHKRALDNTFFTNQPTNKSDLMDEEKVASFKRAYDDEVDKINAERTGKVFMMSPFANNDTRNKCSKNSYVLKNNTFHRAVVKVEVPHFEQCENIPLRRSPILASFNDTLDFQRNEQGAVGRFDLYRLRFNNIMVSSADDRYSVVTSDLIDVAIAHKTDAELVDFWRCGRCINIQDPTANTWRVWTSDGRMESVKCWLVVPDIATCLHDLDKMLHVYKCQESKRKKRASRHAKLLEMLQDA